jgi:hypothetical protein
MRPAGSRQGRPALAAGRRFGPPQPNRRRHRRPPAQLLHLRHQPRQQPAQPELQHAQRRGLHAAAARPPAAPPMLNSAPSALQATSRCLTPRNTCELMPMPGRMQQRACEPSFVAGQCRVLSRSSGCRRRASVPRTMHPAAGAATPALPTNPRLFNWQLLCERLQMDAHAAHWRDPAQAPAAIQLARPQPLFSTTCTPPAGTAAWAAPRVLPGWALSLQQTADTCGVQPGDPPLKLQRPPPRCPPCTHSQLVRSFMLQPLARASRETYSGFMAP